MNHKIKMSRFDFGRGGQCFHKGRWCQRWHLFLLGFHHVWHIPVLRGER